MGSYHPETIQNHSYQLKDFSTREKKVFSYPKTFTFSEMNKLASEEKVKCVPQKCCSVPSVRLARKAELQLIH